MSDKITVEEYLRRNAVIDPNYSLDGSWVPLCVAHLAAELLSQNKLELKPPSWIIPQKFVNYRKPE
jgi:hypothetical protein